MNFWFAANARATFNTAAFPRDSAPIEAIAQVLNVKLFHQLVGAILTLFAGQVVTNLQNGHQVIEDAKATENGGFLRQVANTTARMQRQKADVFIINDDITGITRTIPTTM